MSPWPFPEICPIMMKNVFSPFLFNCPNIVNWVCLGVSDHDFAVNNSIRLYWLDYK